MWPPWPAAAASPWRRWPGTSSATSDPGGPYVQEIPSLPAPHRRPGGGHPHGLPGDGFPLPHARLVRREGLGGHRHGHQLRAGRRLRPAFGWGAGEHVHEPLIQSTLTVTKPDLTIGYDDLATGYSVSDDGLTWTVTIRDDARFTDGEALTAEDVAFTYNTVKESSSVNDFTMLDRAEAVDETTVAFHMNTPFSIWPYTMAVVGIVPEHAYDSATYGQNPIGSGRYVLKQWDRGQQIILEANPDYYGEAPTIRRFTILFLEEDAAFLAVQAGQVDLAYTSATYSDQSVAGYSLTAYRTVDNRGFNLPAVPAGTNAQGQAIGNDFTSDVLVRRAINIGIDREEMIRERPQRLRHPGVQRV